jgi:hypothetical protein
MDDVSAWRANKRPMHDAIKMAVLHSQKRCKAHPSLEFVAFDLQPILRPRARRPLLEPTHIVLCYVVLFYETHML